MSFHPGLIACEPELIELSKDRTIVGMAGVVSDQLNLTLVAASGSLIQLAKISLSSEDDALCVKRGYALNVFLPGMKHPHALRWAVLNCHDYTSRGLGS
jgi:hypothetical protein